METVILDAVDDPFEKKETKIFTDEFIKGIRKGELKKASKVALKHISEECVDNNYHCYENIIKGGRKILQEAEVNGLIERFN